VRAASLFSPPAQGPSSFTQRRPTNNAHNHAQGSARLGLHILLRLVHLFQSKQRAVQNYSYYHQPIMSEFDTKGHQKGQQQKGSSHPLSKKHHQPSTTKPSDVEYGLPSSTTAVTEAPTPGATSTGKCCLYSESGVSLCFVLIFWYSASVHSNDSLEETSWLVFYALHGIVAACTMVLRTCCKCTWASCLDRPMIIFAVDVMLWSIAFLAMTIVQLLDTEARTPDTVVHNPNGSLHEEKIFDVLGSALALFSANFHGWLLWKLMKSRSPTTSTLDELVVSPRNPGEGRTSRDRGTKNNDVDGN
jgi:hypothetical protein